MNATDQAYRGILIDPKNKSITEVSYSGNFRNIYEHIGAELFDVVRVNKDNTLFVDDEGLINGKAQEEGMFVWFGKYPAFLAGKGLLLGNSGEDTVGTTMTIEDVRNAVDFGSPARFGNRLVFLGEKGIYNIEG